MCRESAPSFVRWRPLLQDPNDEMVVEVAVASQADFIVTHNLRDFGPAKGFALRVLAPGAFLNPLLRS
jgi:predicted nucleic acid-binding protein